MLFCGSVVVHFYMWRVSVCLRFAMVSLLYQAPFANIWASVLRTFFENHCILHPRWEHFGFANPWISALDSVCGRESGNRDVAKSATIDASLESSVNRRVLNHLTR